MSGDLRQKERRDVVTLLLVFVGGVVGAPTRYLIDRFVQRRRSGVFPWGTLTVNLIGSFILGVLVVIVGPDSTANVLSGHAASTVMTLAGTGFCGALTTFSTFGFETMRLLEEGSRLEAALNAFGSLVLGVLAALAGHALATWLV